MYYHFDLFLRQSILLIDTVDLDPYSVNQTNKKIAKEQSDYKYNLLEWFPSIVEFIRKNLKKDER